MAVQQTLNHRNYKALELFTDGRFAEAAKVFTIPEFRCAALLNAGDRAGLLAETPSYDQRLFLAVARGWTTGRLLRRIAREGLCKPPHCLAPWIGMRLKGGGRLPPKRIAENLIVPATASRGGATSFARDQMEIDKRILSEDFDGARDLLDPAPER